MDWRDYDLFAPTPEHRQLAETLREFVSREVEPQAADHDRSEAFNHALFRRAGEIGLLGVTLPEEHGGAGLDATAAVQVFEALATSDPGFALSVLAHAILFAQNVAVNGNDEQRRRVLPRAASGEWIGGLCISEPQGGTDVLAMQTRATRDPDGDGYALAGTKTWISNSGIDEQTLGDAFVVYAMTRPREITTFLVEKGMPGFALGPKWTDKLGMRSSFTAELRFDDVHVPAANRLGDEGEGALQMMRNLEIERLTLAAISLGIAQRSLEVMIEHANERKSFGVAIKEHGQIQRHIAESFAEYRAARALVYETARRLDLTASSRGVDADAAKLFASQVGKRVADAAIQVLGGYGYVGEYVVSRLWRDAKLIEIGGGTIEAHHLNLVSALSRNPSLVRD
jgi:isovaleryl-CoA dehydrogenase